MDKVISVDWLEYFVHVKDHELLGGIDKKSFGNYEFIRNEYGTKFFTYSYDIKERGRSIATMICRPRAKFIDDKVATIKIANYILYAETAYKIIDKLLMSLPVKVKGITRIDIACDLLTFENDYRPHKFIKDFVGKDKDDDGYIHHYGSKEFAIFGDKNLNSNSKFNYIRFGSRKSNVQCYIYNKSKELREIKDKPYIRDVWALNNLIVDKKDVWRVEISIKAQGLKVLDKETGQMYRIDSDYISRQSNIEAIFYAYADKYLHFGIKNGQKRAKDYNRLVLIKAEGNVPYRPYNPSTQKNSGRTEKIIIKRLLQASEEYIDMASYIRKSIIDTVNFFATICGQKEGVYKITERIKMLQSLCGYKYLRDDGLEMYSADYIDDYTL
uniref:Replication initiation factor n=1 Tax=uncultured prokaryote TaxID=198431 RepID=A0A0H5Q0H9_9ZZZZ|nr:hypothetical protein [uncultured prokaryote]